MRYLMEKFSLSSIPLSKVVMALFLLVAGTQNVLADRIKDLASIAGVRANQLLGYGLVVGLDGTGDQTSQTPFTVQSMKSMLAQYGVALPANVNPQLKNVAAVSVYAELPPFSKPGQTLDITVASLGNAKSLRGGSLLMTPLKGIDGQVYAIAQGNLVVSGLGVSGADGSKISVNIPSTGRIPGGATVEKVVPNEFLMNSEIILNLHVPDFTTSTRLERVINETTGTGIAQALDAVSIRVTCPEDIDQRVGFVAFLENLPVEPGEASARVIVNSRSGTVVIGSNVRVTPAAIAHGNMTVTITEDPLVSQPPAFSNGGSTQVVPRSSIEVKQESTRMFVFNPGVTLDEIVKAINQVGAAPGDIVAILEALKQAGALRAQLIVI